MAPLRVSVLGGFSARSAPAKPVVFPTKKSQGLLAFLALRPGQVYTREKLAALLWGDSSEDQARHSLRQALFDLRRALPRTKLEILRSNGEGVALNPAAVEVDAAELERLVAAGTPQTLARAADLYRGDLLEGLSLKEESWEEWLRAERERLRGLGVEALKKLHAYQAEAGATDAAIQTASRLLAVDPLQEVVHRSLMRLYLTQGRRAAALRQYQMCVDVLQRELGVEPEAETRELYRDLLPQRVRPPEASDLAPSRAVRGRQPAARPPRRLRSTAETPLVGRGPELDRLRQAMKEAWAGRGRVVAILGEAGTGKTRLIDELTEIAHRRGGLVVLGRCYETEQIFPFGPWVEILRTSIKGQEFDGLSPVWQAELSRLLPELGEPRVQLPASVEDHHRLFDAIVQLVRHLARQQPQVLVLDDLQWADEMSLRLLSFLGRRTQGAPVFVVGASRDDELDGVPLLSRTLDEFDRADHLVRLTLSPLSREHTMELVEALMPSDGALSASIAEQVWTTSEGNPFMVVETARALREGGDVPADRQLPMPDRVRRLISSRLERLSERAQELASIAAVVGREFEFALLQRASGVEESESAVGIEELVRRRVMRGTEDRFGFNHDRIREVVYARLLAPSRRLLHGRVARAIEELYGEDLAPHYGVLGVHYREGEIWAKAVTYLRHAGMHAATRWAHRDAVTWFEQALVALNRQPESRDTREQGIDLRFDLRVSLVALGEIGRAADFVREAEQVATRRGDEERLASAACFWSDYFSRVADYERAISTGEAALASAARVGNLPIQLETNVRLAQVYQRRGEFRRAIDYLRKNLASVEATFIRDRFGRATLASVISRTYLAVCLADLGEFAEGIDHGREAIRLAESVEHPSDLCTALVGLGHLYTGKGDLDDGIPLLERCLELCRTWGVKLTFPWVATCLGAAYVGVGRRDEGIHLLQQAVTESASLHGRVSYDWFLSELASAYLRMGRIAEARPLAREALELARDRGDRRFHALALYVSGEIEANSEPPDVSSAETFFREAIALMETLEMRPRLANCRLALGRLYAKVGRIDCARAELSLANDLFRSMSMDRWAARAGTALASL